MVGRFCEAATGSVMDENTEFVTNNVVLFLNVFFFSRFDQAASIVVTLEKETFHRL